VFKIKLKYIDSRVFLWVLDNYFRIVMGGLLVGILGLIDFKIFQNIRSQNRQEMFSNMLSSQEFQIIIC